TCWYINRVINGRKATCNTYAGRADKDGASRASGSLREGSQGATSFTRLARRPRSYDQFRPTDFNQSLATFSGSCLSTATLRMSWVRVGVSSLADTAFSLLRAVSVTADLYTSGVTFCELNRFFGSIRVTKPLTAMAGSVVNRLATWMSPFCRELTVTGPAVSRERNSLNSSPYTSLRPMIP